MSHPTAVVLVTGSELVRGGRTDENGPFLARELSTRGIEPERILVVGDHPEGLERDQFDHHSVHSLLVHQSSGQAVGTVRLVLPRPDAPPEVD